MTLLKTIKKIELQQKIIQQLEEENKYLKEQLSLCGGDKVIVQNELHEDKNIELNEILSELNNIKKEYQKLVREIKTDKRKLRFRAINAKI